MRLPRPLLLPVLLLLFSAAVAGAAHPEARACSPTPEDEMGPFYRPHAPVRSSVGQGYVLSGQVLSARDCSPLRVATIEIWMIGPHGRYGDPWRATLFPGMNGRYRFEGPFPALYASRPPHIHLRVVAPGHRPLITQHYPVRGTTAATFDLVLTPLP